jgi:plastocyanin
MRGSVGLLAGAVMIVCACSDYTGPGDPGDGGPPPATAGVSVEDDQFVRAAVQVLQGGQVQWTWRGGNQHNVTFTGGPASGTQSSGTFQRTFPTAGTFNYMCTIHGQSMSGSVTVVAASQVTP